MTFLKRMIGRLREAREQRRSRRLERALSRPDVESSAENQAYRDGGGGVPFGGGGG